ncbi:MAG TPA: hypothetical protein VFI37_16120, partial [Gaiellaceae bacterium]|nr:hypothetical protein [Gaiellaceae bacterium]
MADGWIGRSLRRREDDRLLRGQGRYVADVTFPDEVHGVFVRSPYAHALVQGIDTAAALALPGVVAVLTHEDVPPG